MQQGSLLVLHGCLHSSISIAMQHMPWLPVVGQKRFWEDTAEVDSRATCGELTSQPTIDTPRNTSKQLHLRNKQQGRRLQLV